MPDQFGKTREMPRSFAVILDLRSLADWSRCMGFSIAELALVIKVDLERIGHLEFAVALGSNAIEEVATLQEYGYETEIAYGHPIGDLFRIMETLESRRLNALIVCSDDPDFVMVAISRLRNASTARPTTAVLISAPQFPSSVHPERDLSASTMAPGVWHRSLLYSADVFIPLDEILKGNFISNWFQKRIFLCHAHEDKPAVRALANQLRDDGFIAWFDEKDLLPGHHWADEILLALRSSAAVLVCISRTSTNKEGFVQKEIKYALDIADEKPEGSIFIVPVRLEECDVPARLRRWQWVNLFEASGYDRVVAALRSRQRSIAGQGS